MERVYSSPDRVITGPNGGGRLNPNKKGEKRGRKPGIQNKTTRILKEAGILAAEQVGADDKGLDGVVGYLRTMALTERVAFLGFLKALLPMQVTVKGDPDSPLVHLHAHIHEIRGEARDAVFSGVARIASRGSEIENTESVK